MNFIDLTGQKFGRLTVLYKTRKIHGDINWMCKCDCGKNIEVCGGHLRSGHTKSCGCYREDRLKERARDETSNSAVKVYRNNFDIDSDLGFCNFRKDGGFVFDPEDYDKLKDYSWHNNGHGYAVSRESETQKQIFAHRIITDCPDELVVDHINHDTLDNRKSNLRVCTHSENMRNMKKPVRNTSGVKGVYFDKSANRWRAEIKVNGKKTYIGVFEKLDDAKIAREKAEIEYFGEFANISSD